MPGAMPWRARIEDAAASIEVAAEATRLLPGLLGQDEDRRWIVALLTPSELRGAGGLAGDYAELQTTAGAVDLVETYSAAELKSATDPQVQGELLPPIYHEQYGGFSPSYFWQNLSVTPDVPTFASSVAATFPALPFGGEVGGFVTIDPIAVEALLQLTGPITVPLWPVPITADNARDVLLFEQYDELMPEQLDEFQADLVEALTGALTSGALPGPSELAATLAPAVAGGHLHLWSPDRAEQALFQRIGADGALESSAGGRLRAARHAERQREQDRLVPAPRPHLRADVRSGDRSGDRDRDRHDRQHGTHEWRVELHHRR